MESREKGTPICRGIAIGKPYNFKIVDDAIPNFKIPPSDLELEVKRYKKALARAAKEIKQLQKRLETEHVAEGAAILEAHLHIMRDPLMTTRIEEEIRETHKNAEHIFHHVIKEYQKKFLALSDPVFREKFKDVEDIARRVLSCLMKTVRFTLADIPKGSVVFAKELTASDIAETASDHVEAFVTEYGGPTSHAAIVAKAKGIPFITNVNFEKINENIPKRVIVDGRVGEVILNPSANVLAHYETLQDQLDAHLESLDNLAQMKAETYDGFTTELMANVDIIEEIETVHTNGAAGIGLFRTEFLFMDRGKFPSEEDQFEAYREIAEKMNGLPVVIRTFDVGGDKVFPDQQLPREGNPFLGCRAIRFFLKEAEVFKNQLRAILRASAYGDVRIIFPMISALSELLEAKALLEEARRELAAKKVKMADYIPIGSMIEVPSAAIIADLLAKECDFLSIGTNDLVQYSMAVDRTNHALSGLNTPTHPSVIRLIKMVVTEANHHGIPVTVCGEVAADPRFTPLLLGLGVHELSVATRYIPVVKNAVRQTSIVCASKLAEKVLTLSNAAEIQELLDREYKSNSPDDCFYNVCLT